MIEIYERVNIMVPNGTKFHINDTLYSSTFKTNLLNFKDIHRDGYHIEIVSILD